MRWHYSKCKHTQAKHLGSEREREMRGAQVHFSCETIKYFLWVQYTVCVIVIQSSKNWCARSSSSKWRTLSIVQSHVRARLFFSTTTTTTTERRQQQKYKYKKERRVILLYYLWDLVVAHTKFGRKHCQHCWYNIQIKRTVWQNWYSYYNPYNCKWNFPHL